MWLKGIRYGDVYGSYDTETQHGGQNIALE